MTDLREQIAAAHHAAWCRWVEDEIVFLRHINHFLDLSGLMGIKEKVNDKIKQFEKFNKPYSKLPERLKDNDREFADEVLKLIKEGK